MGVSTADAARRKMPEAVAQSAALAKFPNVVGQAVVGAAVPFRALSWRVCDAAHPAALRHVRPRRFIGGTDGQLLRKATYRQRVTHFTGSSRPRPRRTRLDHASRSSAAALDVTANRLSFLFSNRCWCLGARCAWWLSSPRRSMLAPQKQREGQHGTLQLLISSETFESGRSPPPILRGRHACATVYAAGDAAKAEPSRGLKMLGIKPRLLTAAGLPKMRDSASPISGWRAPRVKTTAVAPI